MQPLVSGEGVRLDLPLAGPGSRGIATVIDLAVQVVALMLASVLVGLASAGGGPAAAAAVFVTLLVLIFGGYPIVSEWLSRGRTLGKLVMGVRVVRDDAGPIGFRHALVRGLCSLVLEKPGILIPLGTAAGLFTATGSSSWKRIGDLLAGTLVIQDRRPGELTPLPWLSPPAALWAWAQSVDMSALDDAFALTLRRFVQRARTLTPAARAQLENQLANRLLAMLTPRPPVGVPAETLLITVLAERRRRANAHPEAGSWPPSALPAPDPSVIYR